MMRQEMLARIRDREAWDLIVIGGGATGLGTGLDAVSRGYRTLLLEAHDFAKGTSSRSTKLIHGGVRYLAQGRIGLVHEALHERGALLRNAPHLVHDLEFVIPAYSRWARPYYGLGLALYDVLAGRHGLGSSRSLGRQETLERLPTLRGQGLRGGILYHDGQFDDARLAIALLRTFLDLGGSALNYVAVTALLKRDGRVRGVGARDAETGEEFSIEAKGVVNATGVFADGLRHLDDPRSPTMIAPSRGSHLVLDRSFLPGPAALMVPQTEDGRVLFAIPWHGRTLLGTTDVPVPLAEIEPRASEDEVEFLLRHAARYLSAAPQPSDILSTFAGLRPLVGAEGHAPTSRLSRELALTVSDSGLVTITGGKWTTYRRMGIAAVDRASLVAGLPRNPSSTETLKLHGWIPAPVDGPDSPYGSDAEELERLASEHPGWELPFHPDLPGRVVEVVWAARREAARTVEDVLARRTRSLFLNARASRDAAPRVAEILAAELGRDRPWQEAQVRGFHELSTRYLLR